MDFREPKRRKDGAGDANRSSAVLISIRKVKDFLVSTMQSLDEFRLLGILSDVTLIAGVKDDTISNGGDYISLSSQEEILAHRCVLAARSDYFKAMFTIGMSESKQQTITIHGVNHHLLKKVVDFIYTGSCKVSRDEIQDLTTAGAMMQIPSLLGACREYLLDNLDVFNVFWVWSLADAYQLTDVLRRCAQMIPNQLGVLLKQEEFLTLPASMVHTILKFPKVNLGPDYNIDILREALQRWVDANRENSNQMAKLENYVDFERLDITLHSRSGEGSSGTRTVQMSDKIETLPDCFSLIAIMGGFLQSRTCEQCPTANTIEVLDTLSLSWQSSSVMSTAGRPILFRTVFVSDGMLYFLAKEKLCVNLYQYEPITSRWNWMRKVEASEALWRLAESTCQVRATAENGHEIYLCGSVTVKSADKGKVAFKIDVKENRVHDLPTLPHPRYHHGAVVVNGDLFVIGGSTLSWEPLATVLILRKGQQQWGERFPMSVPRVGPGVAVVGEYIYAVGGTSTKRLKTAERYHIASNRWESLRPMNSPRAFPGAMGAGGYLFVFGGKSYAGSGLGEDSGARNVLRSGERYDPSTDTWKELPAMDKCRCEMITVTV
ncbi:putative ring canal kelch-like [Apostichopus japonicus]|uniref:Putative ring canal kelch-like n=1 Tax=Stichopus japonicus TaxID=307972 RepID=A0A2G8L6T4_STIJA|nr:putative ring canal kelch-like [Apostichopus japonicus]